MPPSSSPLERHTLEWEKAHELRRSGKLASLKSVVEKLREKDDALATSIDAFIVNAETLGACPMAPPQDENGMFQDAFCMPELMQSVPVMSTPRADSDRTKPSRIFIAGQDLKLYPLAKNLARAELILGKEMPDVTPFTCELGFPSLVAHGRTRNS